MYFSNTLPIKWNYLQPIVVIMSYCDIVHRLQTSYNFKSSAAA